jgi:hypothetical protein
MTGLSQKLRTWGLSVSSLRVPDIAWPGSSSQDLRIAQESSDLKYVCYFAFRNNARTFLRGRMPRCRCQNLALSHSSKAIFVLIGITWCDLLARWTETSMSSFCCWIKHLPEKILTSRNDNSCDGTWTRGREAHSNTQSSQRSSANMVL